MPVTIAESLCATVSPVEPADEPLTVDEAAARLRVSAQWLRKEAAAGRVPSLKLGQRRLFLERHLAEIIAAAEVRMRTGLSEGSLRVKRRATPPRAW